VGVGLVSFGLVLVETFQSPTRICGPTVVVLISSLLSLGFLLSPLIARGVWTCHLVGMSMVFVFLADAMVLFESIPFTL